MSVSTELLAVSDALIGLWLPRRCLLCGATPLGGREIRLCAGCRRKLRTAPSPSETPRWRGVEAGWAATSFTGDVRELLLRLKYRREVALAADAARLVTQARHRDTLGRLGPFDALVPVPLHPRRRRERGFNQAERIACAVAARLRGVPVVGAIERTRDTPSQIGRDPVARRRNLRGAFRPVARVQVRGRAVVLVDDVVTTGATVAAAARALRAAGARRVAALAVAASGGPSEAPAE